MVNWLKNIMFSGNTDSREDLTVEQIRERAETLARAAGYKNASYAYHLLDEGKLDGTMLQMELEMLRFLEQAPHNKAA